MASKFPVQEIIGLFGVVRKDYFPNGIYLAPIGACPG